MARQTIYTVGGTVQAGGGIYIKRKADDELLELCKQGEFAFILSSRQVGKSSLMVHTAQALAADNICSVIIDLSALGTSVTQDEWYLGILNEIHSSLNLETDIFGWWQQYSQLGPSQRLTNFFKDVLLKEVKEQVVLFFDEIDSTLSIPFSDDFYVALRAVYNARSTTPDFKRLSFVLVGVAAPSDLISDNRRTPFNIGRRVEIKDFTLSEALPLAQGLGQQAEKVLAWVLQYSGGHPYLTQRLCADLANSREVIDEQTVANTVERLFTGEQGKQDNNLQFVRDMLSKRSPDVEKVLSIYKEVRSGKNVLDDERSIAKAHLKLSGLVRSEQGFLRVRNEIYNSVFNLHWIQENTPKNWQRTAVISLSAVLGLLVLAALGIFVNDFLVGTRVNKSIADFISTTSSKERLTNLAKIYSQGGILSNRDSSLQAAQLFYGLSAKDQLSMLTDYAIPREPRLQKDLVVVVGHLYVTVADVNPIEDNTELLKTMRDSLKNVQNDQIAVDLQAEISSWLDGRAKARNQDYRNALSDYTDAINANPNNQATLYERAKVYVALERYTEALKDLDAALAKAKASAPSPPNTPAPTESPLPASETPPTNASRPTSASSRPTTIASGETATNTPAPTAAISLTPTPPSQSAGTSQVDSYESHFTTWIDVLNAVSALIEAEPGLQAAIQGNVQQEYTNLRLYGLLKNYPTQPPPTGLLAEILRRGYILVSTDPNYEPRSFLNTQGKRPSDTKCPADALTIAEMQGFDVDVAKAIGDDLGVETCFATPSWDAVTAGNWADKWDISVGSMVITTARQQILDFSTPYYYTPAVIAVRSGSGINSLTDLDAKALCVGSATTYEDWLNGNLGLPSSSLYAQPPAKSTVVSLDTDQECAQALAAGRNDFVGYVTSESVVDADIASGMPLAKLGGPVFAEELAAALDKSSTLSTDGLRAEVDKLFTAMHDDGRLSELSNKWFGEDLTQPPELQIQSIALTSTAAASTEAPAATEAPTEAPVATEALTEAPVSRAISAEIPSDFPSPFIRVRNYPDLNSTVMGSVEPSDQVLVTAYTFNGWIWYQLDVPTRGIKDAWISGVIALNGKNYASVVSSTDIQSNTPLILLKDIVKP